jgi:hypothetical protein
METEDARAHASWADLPPPAAAGGGDGGVASSSGRCGDAEEDLRRALHRIQSGAVRGALIGLTLRGGLHLAGTLLGALGTAAGGRRGRGRKRAVGGGDAAKDALRYAAFLGALAATYIGVDEGIARAFGKERSSKWRALVAGACAGPTLLLTG